MLVCASHSHILSQISCSSACLGFTCEVTTAVVRPLVLRVPVMENRALVLPALLAVPLFCMPPLPVSHALGPHRVLTHKSRPASCCCRDRAPGTPRSAF